MSKRGTLQKLARLYAVRLRKYAAIKREAAAEEACKLGRATAAAGLDAPGISRLRRYAAKLRKHLASEREAILEQSYQLGRAAIGQGMGILDMARIDLEARDKLLQSKHDEKKRRRISKLAGTFFLQSLSPFEATHRGFRETNAELKKRNSELKAQVLERQRAENALRESQARYSTLIETAHDVIFSLAPDGRITALNPAFQKITGWPPSAWLGKAFAPLVHPDDVTLAVERFYGVLQGKLAPQLWEYRVRKSDGQFIIGEFTLARELKNGKPVGVFGIGRDITERKRAEEALRLSEERFRLLVSNVKDYAIFLLEPDGRVASWNVGAERIYGYREDEIFGRHVSCFYPPQDTRSGKPQRHLETARQRGWIEEEGWRVRKDGSRYWANTVITAVRDESGELRWFAKIVRDMTERKQMDEALRQLSRKILEAQEEERRRISRELHDEVGQSLTAVSVALATLRHNGVADSENFSRTLAGSQRLLVGTMETVHRFARELRPALLDELGLLPAVRSHVKNFAARSGLRVRFSADAAAERLNVEQKTALFRIAQESLTNVAKHAHASRVRFSIRQTEDGICMEIADNGRSFRGDPGTAAKQKQRLGLLGMQERVKLLNGEFSILPEPGRGTTVRVTIPFQAADARN
ncbi:MAG: PAS domain S-box protein [Verrucomicrobiota bacterium]|nr:PAS domain S-box protein [Verrucomicrobiota bacterium]